MFHSHIPRDEHNLGKTGQISPPFSVVYKSRREKETQRKEREHTHTHVIHLHLYSNKRVESIVRPLLVVNVFLVTQSSRRACGRAVIIIHYSIIFGCGLPVQIEHFLLYLNRMYYANTIEHAQCKTIMAISRGPQKCMRAGDQKHVYNKQWPNIKQEEETDEMPGQHHTRH